MGSRGVKASVSKVLASFMVFVEPYSHILKCFSTELKHRTEHRTMFFLLHTNPAAGVESAGVGRPRHSLEGEVRKTQQN